MPKRRICVVVTARPSYARIQTVIEALHANPAVDLSIVMAASSLLHHYGKVEDDCPFPVHHRLWSTLDGHNHVTTATETGLLTIKLAQLFYDLKPDVVVTIADRHETLATAMAASYQHIPLAHVQGGERTGSIDDKVRNAVSALADLHFPATPKAAHRLWQQDVKGTIFQYGCPSIDLAARVEPDPSYAHTIIVLQHPVTGEATYARAQAQETYHAVTAFRTHKIVWFWPGQDAGTEGIAKFLREQEHSGQHGIEWRRHLPAARFLSALLGCAALVGNSSVGIRETAFLGVPTVDVGNRQMGRERGQNVLHAPHLHDAIEAAIHHQIAHGPYAQDTLYGTGDAGRRIAAALLDPAAVGTAEALDCHSHAAG